MYYKVYIIMKVIYSKRMRLDIKNLVCCFHCYVVIIAYVLFLRTPGREGGKEGEREGRRDREREEGENPVERL